MKDTNIPTFLVVGAAKAGTTSLHQYLASHPNIFMSTPKEPKFFSFNCVKCAFSGPGDYKALNDIIKDKEGYIKLFKGSDVEITQFGESSPDNLYYHRDVIPLIKQMFGDLKIIVLLRNPIDRAFSAYSHLVRDGRETLSFEDALENESNRIKSGYEFIWHYKAAGRYFLQVKDYLDNFSNCKVILFDDLKNNPQNVFDEVCNFINVERRELKEMRIYNPSGIPKNKYAILLYRAISRDFLLKRILKRVVPRTKHKFISSKFREELLYKQLAKNHMSEDTRRYLNEYFKDDIEKLEKLLHFDLSSWKFN